MVRLGSDRMKMVHIKASHMSSIWGLCFLRSKFPCLELFRYLQAVGFVSNLCLFSIFLVFSNSVMYAMPLFSRCFDDVCYLPHCLVYLLILLFCCIAVFPCCSDNPANINSSIMTKVLPPMWIIEFLFVHVECLTLLIAIFIILWCSSRNANFFWLFFYIFCYSCYKIIIFLSNLTCFIETKEYFW